MAEDKEKEAVAGVDDVLAYKMLVAALCAATLATENTAVPQLTVNRAWAIADLMAEEVERRQAKK